MVSTHDDGDEVHIQIKVSTHTDRGECPQVLVSTDTVRDESVEIDVRTHQYYKLAFLLCIACSLTMMR